MRLSIFVFFSNVVNSRTLIHELTNPGHTDLFEIPVQQVCRYITREVYHILCCAEGRSITKLKVLQVIDSFRRIL